MSPRSPAQPGLAKTRLALRLERRAVEQWRLPDHGWRELFDRADVVSEGALRHEPEGDVYYGSTSLILPLSVAVTPSDALGRSALARAAASNPHVRLRAVRLAALEAEQRASCPLARIAAELNVTMHPRGVRIDIEVEARLSEPARALASSAEGATPAPMRRR